MIDVLDSKKCCGCSACMDICHSQAIEMVPDREGFLYPVVDTEKCTNCGLCEKVCPAIELPNFNSEPDVYALQLKDNDVLKLSQSGGAFAAIASIVLEKNGVVYGAALNECLRVVHDRAENAEEMKKFHGSKYVQTDMRGIMKLIKADLVAGREVLFTGTACHVAGLYKYLGKRYDNLLTCDLICHGVPTPLLFERFIEYLKKKTKKDITNFKWGYYDTDSGTSWNTPRKECVFFDRSEYLISDKYINEFYSNSYLRPYCHNCPYTKTERVADFTIGDYWGANNYTQKFDTDKGLSVIFFNSEKAKPFVGKMESTAILEKADMENVKKRQPNLRAPTAPNKRRSKLMDKLINKGFISAYRSDRLYYMLYCLKQKVLKR